jgi:mono/diheme cytochrome c family protein
MIMHVLRLGLVALLCCGCQSTEKDVPVTSASANASPRSVEVPKLENVVTPGPGGRPAKLTAEPGIPKFLEDYPGYEDSRTVRKSMSMTQDSVARGKKIYTESCVVCHGVDGSGPEGRTYNVAKKARDLSEPLNYRYGSSDQAIFRTIFYGVPSTPMGGYKKSLSQDDVWDIVNYLRSM